MLLNNEALAKKKKEEGNVYSAQKNYSMAIKCYDQAISYSPEVKEYWFNKGLAHQMLEQNTEALFALNEALKIDPCYQKAIDNKNFVLAKMLLMENKYQEAYKLCKQCPKTARVELATIESANFFKAEIFFGRVDLKLTDSGKIKILQFGNGMQSTFRGLSKVCEQNITSGIKHNLSSFGLPFEVLDSPGLVPLDKLSKSIEFVKKNNISPKSDIDFSTISSYSGMYCSKFFDPKLYPNVLAVGSNLPASIIADDNILSHRMFEGLEDYRPATKILPRKYFPNLAKEITKGISGEIYVIKVPDLSGGHGFWFTLKSHLNEVLKFLLEPKEFEANVLFNSYLHSKISKKFHEELLKLFFIWRSSNSPFFMIEAHVPSKGVVYDNKSYDPTMRVAFLIIRDNYRVTFKPIGAYWQLPKESIDHLDVRLRCNIAISSEEQNYLPVDSNDLELVYKQLSTLLPQLFQKIFTFDFEKYRKTLIASSEDSEKKYGYYITTRIANELGRRGYLVAGLELLNSIKDSDLMPYKIYHERGVIYYNNDLYEKAIEQFSEALKMYPNIPTYYRRGLSYYALGMLDKALDDLNHAASGSPDHMYRALYEQVKKERDLVNSTAPKTKPSLSIDLHGRSVKEAKLIVDNMLKKSKKSKTDQLTVITGIGNHKNRDGSRGVLFQALPKWLKSYSSDIKSVKQDMGAYEIKFNYEDDDGYGEYIDHIKKQYSFLNDNQSKEFVGKLEQQSQLGDLESKGLLSCLYINGILVSQDISKGLSLLMETAEKYIDSQLQLGFIFSSDVFGLKDYKKAIKWFSKAADKGHPRAFFELGKMYWLGCGVIKNDPKAIEYLTLAANYKLPEVLEEIKPFLAEDYSYFMETSSSGRTAAAHSLGGIYFDGYDSVKADGQLAAKYYLIAAKANIVEAQLVLAKQYFFGWGINNNDKQAFFWFEKAALAGNGDAQYYLGRCYKEGRGIDCDLDKATIWYTKSAEQGDLDAQFEIAYGYLIGMLVEKDVDKGIKQLEHLGAQDHNHSLFVLGSIFLKKGSQQNISKAIEYIKRSAKLEQIEAQKLLSRLYINGEHFKADVEQSVYWLREAAKKNDPEALYNLSIILETSTNQSNPEESLNLMIRSAELGFVDAQYMLGLCYLEGDGGADKDVTKAMQFLEKASDQGNTEAKLTLAKIYLSSTGSIVKDPIKAFNYFKQAASEGNSDANTGLGFCYMGGKGVLKDLEKAKHYFSLAAAVGDQAALQNLGYLLQQDDNGNKKILAKKSIKQLTLEAEKGNSDSQYELSSCYIKGMASYQEHFGEGIYWLHRCASQNHPGGIYMLKRMVMQEKSDLFIKEIKKGLAYEYMLRQDFSAYPSILGFEELDFDLKLVSDDDPVMQRNLGIKYRFGQGTTSQNYDKAIKWFQKAAIQNDPEALYNLGAMYQAGQGVTKDPVKAIYWFKKAAELGNSDAQFVLGMVYKSGENVTQNQATAAKWLQMSAEQGDPEAQFFLGSMYRDGEGVKQSNKESIKWLQKAANQGNDKAQYDLGVMYQTGDERIQDDRKAVSYYQKAADQDNPDAQCSLAWMYISGKGIAQDNSKAMYWFEKAANQGQASAQCNLGAAYLLGTDVPQNTEKALEWFQKAADQGNADAMHNLGLMYQSGQGVLQDYHKAIEWYKKAAEKGNTNSQNNLGFMYQNGEGVPKNYSESIKWYQKAACQGNAAAQENLAAICEDSGYAVQDKKILKKPRPTF